MARSMSDFRRSERASRRVAPCVRQRADTRGAGAPSRSAAASRVSGLQPPHRIAFQSAGCLSPRKAREDGRIAPPAVLQCSSCRVSSGVAGAGCAAHGWPVASARCDDLLCSGERT